MRGHNVHEVFFRTVKCRPQGGTYMAKNVLNLENLLYSNTILQKLKIYSYDVREAFNQNWEIHGPW